ncbi:uncharacterized protein LOC128164277 isoform X2 [Crassostrea angulata]|uniref:uncharacterized protein LOC128164277 isoform X2 n=1 Tax=Magallana angulata TaxID=2784310 RepID=UPI0022B09F5D|nr:uncharacterized protein LOC128164277 isoform X2 [Crassostrea angulata]
MEGCRRLLFFACMCLFIFKRETNASPNHECFNDTDCGKNAVCDISGGETDNVCVCKPGFFDNRPTITALSDGCPGECNEFGETDQCEGNTLCTQTPQGYGLCTCPDNTYGPPECLGECDEFGETDQCEGNTLCTQTPQGYAGNAMSLEKPISARETPCVSKHSKDTECVLVQRIPTDHQNVLLKVPPQQRNPVET